MPMLKLALLVRVVALALALATPALAGPPAPDYPSWVLRGSGLFGVGDGKKRAFYGVGVAAPLKDTPVSEPLGWVAYFRAISEVSKELNGYVEKLGKEYAAAVEKPGAHEPVAELRSFDSSHFGGVALTRLDKQHVSKPADGGAEEQQFGSYLKLTWEAGGLLYKDAQEESATAAGSSQTQDIQLALGKGTDALLSELRGAGVRLVALWVAPDGATFALAELDTTVVNQPPDTGGPKTETPAAREERERARRRLLNAAEKALEDISAEEAARAAPK